MTLITFLLFVFVGCGVDFLAGLFGVGGGMVMVPVLILGYEHSSISLSVLTHLAIGSILLARVGAYVSFNIHPYRLRKLFALFIILIAIYILVN